MADLPDPPFDTEISEILQNPDENENEVQHHDEDSIGPAGDPATTTDGPTDFAILEPLLTHIIEDVLELPPSSIFYNQNEIRELLDLVTLSPTEIMAISARKNNRIQTINKREGRLLVAFYRWYHNVAAQMVDSEIPDNYWYAIKASDFKAFRRKRLPSLTSTTPSPKSTSFSTGDVNVDVVNSFQKSIKLEVNHYPEFKGNLEGWLPFKRKLKAVAATHGIERIVSDITPVIVPLTQDSRLYEMQNNFLYSVFTQKLQGGPSILALRAYEDEKNARAVFLKLVSHYESTSNLMVISQKCHSKIQSLKLHQNY